MIHSRPEPSSSSPASAPGASLREKILEQLSDCEAVTLEHLSRQLCTDPCTVDGSLASLLAERKICRLSPSGLNGSAVPEHHAHLLYYRLRRPQDDDNVWRRRFCH